MNYLSRPLKKFRSVNSSSADFTAPVAAIDLHKTALDAGTAAGRCLIALTDPVSGGGNGVHPCGIELWPYGLGSDNDVFVMRLMGWSRVAPPTSDHRFLFVPTIIAAVTCTISGFVGLAGFPVLNTERFADTITITSEGTTTADVTRAGTVVTYSPANDTPARATIDFDGGFEFLELTFDQTTGTPTMNALYKLIGNE